MTEEKNTECTQWHPAFTAVMHMEFSENKDEFNYSVFLKGIAYAYLYKSKEAHVDEIPLSEVTLTFVREHPPVKLFKKLKEINLVVEEVAPGIYYISGYSELIIQIVVSKELDENQHVWINSLTSQMKETHARKLVDITENLTDLDDKNYADSVWEVIVTENEKLMSFLREDEKMGSALAKIMKPEIDAAFNNGFNDGFNNGFNNGLNDGQLLQLFKLVKKNIITLEEAVGESELNLEEFKKKYAEYKG